MKVLCWIPIFILFLISPWSALGAPISLEKFSLRHAFEEFKAKFNKVYSNVEEEVKRFTCFLETLKKIEDLNRRDTAKHGINQFADMCAWEFKQQFHNLKLSPNRQKRFASEVPYTPIGEGKPAREWDWRKKGAVLPIKDQKHCGSCWTFSAVAAMEGAWFLAGHNLTSLSEEQLVQCAASAGQGCQGGEMSAAINWVIQNGGIVAEDAYPYVSGNGVTGDCDDNKTTTPVAKFSKLLKAPVNETDLPLFVQTYGPIYIAVDAMDGWQTYIGGVKSVCAGQELDHGVAIVGYGPDYWIVRNSWGPIWGEQGYIRLKRGVNCDGMMTDAGTAAV